MIVVDSSVWIDHFNDNGEERSVRVFRAIDDPTRILVGDLVMLEVLRGARDDRHAGRLAAVLESFQVRMMLDPALARIAARMYRTLRDLGNTVRKTPDLVIAAFCLDGGHDLLTKDRDFRPFADHLGLRLL